MKQFTSDQFTWRNGVGTAELSSLLGMSESFSRFTIKSTRTNHTRTYELDTQSPGYEDGWDGEFKQYTDNLFDGTKVIIRNYWLDLSFNCYHTGLMNNNTFEQDWKQCFSQFKELDGMSQQILRRTAVDQLIDQGFNEVGSSDVSASLFSMWKSGNRNWKESYMNAFENFCS